MDFDASSLLSYADADIEVAAGPRPKRGISQLERIVSHWSEIRTTGYGQAVSLGCKALFDVDYAPVNFGSMAEMLQAALKEKSAVEVYDHFVRELANIKWVVQDGYFAPGNEHLLQREVYPDYYRFSWRMDELFCMADAAPIELLERVTGMSVNNLQDLVNAMNANIDTFKATGRLAAFKLAIAYERDLVIHETSMQQAERAFDWVRTRATSQEGVQQVAVSEVVHQARPLADYMIHHLLRRADDEDIPVQIHTGYLTEHWGSLAGTKALHLLPVFEKYRQVRFDVFHGSWPWTSELGAIAKNYPNVYPDMCWMWAMNPAESERTLAEWLDGVPFNKIFAFGADTEFPWCCVGYAIQARIGIAHVLEEKVKKRFFSQETAKEVAAAIMLENGERFHGLG